jgi:hypothetical protein
MRFVILNSFQDLALEELSFYCKIPACAGMTNT